jgi:hypothetical protein
MPTDFSAAAIGGGEGQTHYPLSKKEKRKKENSIVDRNKTTTTRI